MAIAQQKKIPSFFLRHIKTTRIILYPILLFLNKIGLTSFLEPRLNLLFKKYKINTTFNKFYFHKDYASTFRNDFKQETQSSKVILFSVALGVNSLYNVLNLMLAKYLSRRGFQPLFLVCDAALPICDRENINKRRKENPLFCHQCWSGYKHLSRVTGIKVVYLSSLITPEIEDKLKEEEKAVQSLATIRDCLGYSYDNCRIGQIIKKSVLRYFREPKLNEDKNELMVYKKFLYASVKQYMIIDYFLSNNLNIYKIFLHNGTLAFGGICREIAAHHKKDYITYERYMGEDKFIFKLNGEVMNLKWEDDRKDFMKQFVLTEEVFKQVGSFFEDLKCGRYQYTRFNEDIPLKGIDPNLRFACLFTNLNIDTAVLDKNTIFENVEDWVISVIKFWEEEVRDLALVIRIHPAETKLFTSYKNFILAKIKPYVVSKKIVIFDSFDEVSSYELIKRMEFGLVYTSTIGLEIAYSRKPCLVAGDAFYAKESFVCSPATKEDYFNLIRKFINNPPSSSQEIFEDLVSFIYFIYFYKSFTLNGISFRSFYKYREKGMYSEALIEENKERLEHIYREYVA